MEQAFGPPSAGFSLVCESGLGQGGIPCHLAQPVVSSYLLLNSYMFWTENKKTGSIPEKCASCQQKL